MQAALDLAHQLCLKHRVFERPLGLLGVWGGIVREWLQTLLPDNAADRCSGRVRVVVTTLPLFQREVVTEFKVRPVEAGLTVCCQSVSTHAPVSQKDNLALWRGEAEGANVLVILPCAGCLLLLYKPCFAGPC